MTSGELLEYINRLEISLSNIKNLIQDNNMWDEMSKDTNCFIAWVDIKMLSLKLKHYEKQIPPPNIER